MKRDVSKSWFDDKIIGKMSESKKTNSTRARMLIKVVENINTRGINNNKTEEQVYENGRSRSVHI